MAENSNIEWCDHTFNPWIGCQKVSPGCDHCYAEAMMDKRYGRVQWGPHGERVRTSQNNWNMPLRWAKKANGHRPRVFCASLADWLDNRAPREWRSDLGRVIEATPELDWLLLTKRPENYEKLAPWQPRRDPVKCLVGCDMRRSGALRTAVGSPVTVTNRRHGSNSCLTNRRLGL